MWGMDVSIFQVGKYSGSKLQLGFRRAFNCLSIYLPKHDIERSDNGGDVGQHVAARQKVHRRKMRKRGRADLALVGLVGPVGDKVDTKLALGGLDRSIDLAGGNAVAFGIKLEVLDGRLHR